MVPKSNSLQGPLIGVNMKNLEKFQTDDPEYVEDGAPDPNYPFCIFTQISTRHVCHVFTIKPLYN